MKPVKIRFTKLSPDAVTPKYAKRGDNGADLTATSITHTPNYIEYGTSLAIELPPGFVGLIFPRSSISNYDLILSNSTGVLDSNFRGEIKFRFKRTGTKFYEVGERIGQLVVQEVPLMIFEEVAELEPSARNGLGYGSSGK